MLAYVSGYLWFRSYSFHWDDLDGVQHHSTIKVFRNSSIFISLLRSTSSTVYRPLIFLDKIITGRDFDDEM